MLCFFLLWDKACMTFFVGGVCDTHLIGWVRENWPKQSETDKVRSESCPSSHPDLDQCRTVLLHFDHMRSRASYSKTIASWTSELGIVGRLIFCDALIAAVMQGRASDIKVGLVFPDTTFSFCFTGLFSTNPFSALTLFGPQEGDPACEKSGCWFVGGDV